MTEGQSHTHTQRNAVTQLAGAPQTSRDVASLSLFQEGLAVCHFQPAGVFESSSLESSGVRRTIRLVMCMNERLNEYGLHL